MLSIGGLCGGVAAVLYPDVGAVTGSTSCTVHVGGHIIAHSAAVPGADCGSVSLVNAVTIGAIILVSILFCGANFSTVTICDIFRSIFHTVTGNSGSGAVVIVNIDVTASFISQDANIGAASAVSLYVLDAPASFVSLAVCVMGVCERGNCGGGLQVRSLLWTRLEVGRGWPGAINRLLQLVGCSL